jgi:DNA-binding NtrC family response regulator
MIDDDQLVRDFAVHTLEYGINQKVIVFDNGFEAWQSLQNQPNNADIIIADANIPDMDGMELLSHVKQHFPQKKLIITTSNPDIADTASDMGVDALVLKPYDAQDLFEVVQHFFKGRGSVQNGKNTPITTLPAPPHDTAP